MAVLLSPAGRRGLTIALRIAGLWYAVLLVVSLLVTPSDLAAGAPGRWIAWGLHLSPDHDCFMCGLSRSFAAMSHGDWSAAVSYNAGGPVLYLLMAGLAIWAIVSSARAMRPLSRAGA